jgi:hypothetical protein
MHLSSAALALGLMLLAAAVAYHGRYVVASTESNVLILDRWSGRYEACTFSQPEDDYEPPRVWCRQGEMSH